MIITSTPFRISFFGGGTDYPVWFRDHGGAVLSASINRYCYLSVRFYPPFFDNAYRIVWSKTELVNEIEEIQHPVVREAIRFIGIKGGLEIHHDGDLPARTGIGSSSAFAVGILHALRILKGNQVSKERLAKDAIHLEQEMLKEHVGIQDQIITAYGGLNLIEFDCNGAFTVRPLPISSLRKKTFEDHLMLVYTGISRTASHLAKEQIALIPTKPAVLHRMRELVNEAADLLVSERDISEFGHLLHEGWELKRNITNRISTPLIDDLYTSARAAGAIGGKLLGAGGGGFMLLLVPPEKRQSVLDAVKNFLIVPFEIESQGSHVVLYEPDRYSQLAHVTRRFTR